MAVHGLSCGDIIRQLFERDLRKYNPPNTHQEEGQPGGQRVIFNAKPVRTKHKSKTYQLEEYAADVTVSKSLRTDSVLLISSSNFRQVRIVKQNPAHIAHGGNGGANNTPFYSIQLKEE